jgi:hypothetical protein
MKNTKTLRWLVPAAVVALPVLWYAFRPELLFVNRSVSEALPPAAAASATVSKPVASGSFTGLAHQTSGTAAVYEIGGKKFLRFSDFKTSNGPDVHVYLVAGKNGTDNQRIKDGGFLDLGVIKGNVGDQNYELPGDFDLGKYGAVSIWCKRFSVNFGAADLAPSS